MHSATVNSKNGASAKVNISYSDTPVPGGMPWCPQTEGRPAHVLSSAGGLHPAEGVLFLRLPQSVGTPDLAGISVLLVAHEGPVVAQDVHGVLPVPAGAAVVLEAGLGGETTDRKCENCG